ncbi:inactive transglutaminase family protein [Marinobacterium sediminicola]|uniref:Inactive transglutaminase fused to 7 transmembrane helices n=1 Tax=Marinobacterium sediminicola TaxID=518898 RepID=A0ABY1S356_9GAMM|nr:inactive transglutaminase family protein [Marinobacterium sediminicola]ULG68848.1 inactive transglutaminase family protein [Marinobacterium sediminicola]SMR77542.1 Inactive transglutaminase fused to 7 transmembrane helices [Marinobacterium sediminicola]
MIRHSKTPFYLATLLLIAAGLLLAVLRHQQMGVPWLPGAQQPVWLVEARIDFQAWGEPVSVDLNIPDQPPGFHTLTEQAASPGYGFAITEHQGDRRAEWTIRDAAGPQTLYFKTRLIPDSAERDTLLEPGVIKPAEIFLEEPDATAARALLLQAEARSSGPASMTRELIGLLNSATPDQNTRLLLSDAALAPTLYRLLNFAGIPARIADGLQLEDARRQQTLQPWLQVHDGERWLTFNPRTGIQGVPADVLLWRETDGSLLDVTGGTDSIVRFSMLRQTVPALQIVRAEANKRAFGSLSLYQLPVEQQGMFRMLLLLPFGALVVCLMRILVGIKTSGTFMPVLIAVAFVQTSLLPGLAAFMGVVTLGLLMRGYLSSLNLLLVSRISALIILVLFITAGISIIGYQMGFSTGMTVTFFPMVILAWTIERMSILWEEEGAHEVLIQGAGSLIVAILAYLVMRAPLAEHISFNFPELHLVVLGIILLLGQYTGYKLTELRRFAPMKRYQ